MKISLIKIVLAIVFIMLLYNCTQKQAEDRNLTNNTDSSNYLENLKNSKDTLHTQKNAMNVCNCKENENISREDLTKFDISFDKYQISKNDTIFKKYSHDSLKYKVKSIQFLNFDTIPKSYAIFKNVKHVIIETHHFDSGLDIFPNIKTVNFWNTKYQINPNDKWLSKI